MAVNGLGIWLSVAIVVRASMPSLGPETILQYAAELVKAGVVWSAVGRRGGGHSCHCESTDLKPVGDALVQCLQALGSAGSAGHSSLLLVFAAGIFFGGLGSYALGVAPRVAWPATPVGTGGERARPSEASEGRRAVVGQPPTSRGLGAIRLRCGGVMAATAGDIVFLVYDEAPDVYHARILTGHIEGSSWIVVTPTFDVFEEDISLTNPDLIAARFGRGVGIPPCGVRLDMLYEFNPPFTRAQIIALITEGERLAMLKRQARGLVPGPAVPPVPPFAPPAPPAGAGVAPAAAVPAAAAVVAAPAPVAAAPAAMLVPYAGPVPDAHGTPPVGYVWAIADEDFGDGRALGDVVEVGPGPLQANRLSLNGRKGLLELLGGGAVFAVTIPVGEVAGFVSSWRGEDARVLPVAWVHGRRHRDWPDVARKSRQEDFADFPTGKPRTARWCADYLVKDGGPVPHHEVWRSRRRLQATDFGVDMHDTLSRIIEYLGTYGQLDLANSVGVEFLFRMMQLVEYYYDEKDLHHGHDEPEAPFAGGGGEGLHGRWTAVVDGRPGAAGARPEGAGAHRRRQEERTQAEGGAGSPEERQARQEGGRRRRGQPWCRKVSGASRGGFPPPPLPADLPGGTSLGARPPRWLL